MWEDRVRWALAVAVIILRSVTLVQLDDPDPNGCLFSVTDLFVKGFGVTQIQKSGKFTLEECKAACLGDDGCYLMEYWPSSKVCHIGGRGDFHIQLHSSSGIHSFINLCGHDELKKEQGCHHKTTLKNEAIKSSPDISIGLTPDQCAEECNKDQECVGHIAELKSRRCYIFKNIKYNHPLDITLIKPSIPSRPSRRGRPWHGSFRGSDWDVSFHKCNPCLDNPCLNGGNCHREDHQEKCCSYSCPCPGNLKGRNCDRCPDGFEVNLDVDEKCAKCNLISISTEGVNCTQCPDFMVADELNTECVCAPGHYFDDKQTQCTACPQHQYKPEVGNITSCRNCTDDTGTSGTGHRYCDICVEGMGRIEFSTDSSHITCKPCTGDTYSDEKSNQTCQPCGPGAEGSGTNGNSKCDFCVQGYGLDSYPTASRIKCVKCTGQMYSKDKNNQTCQECPANTEGNGKDSDGNTDCVCRPGFGYSKQVCKECEQNSFKTSPGNWSCKSCHEESTGSETSGRGHLKCDICGLGYGVISSSTSSSDHVQCEICDDEMYSGHSDNQTCHPCPPSMTGHSGNNKGNTECICTSGYEPSAGGCKQCNSNSFKSLPGNVSCTECKTKSRGSGTKAVGSVFCDICLEGYGYRGTTNNFVDCRLCTRGKEFSADRNTEVCMPCDDSTHEVAIHNATRNLMVACVCAPGYERLESLCQPCQLQFYKPTSGETACLPCSSADAIASVLCVKDEMEQVDINNEKDEKDEIIDTSVSITEIVLICVGLLVFVVGLIVGALCYFMKKKDKLMKKQHQSELKLARIEGQLARSQSQITDSISPAMAKAMFLMAKDKVLSKSPYDSISKSPYDSSNWASQYDDSTIVLSNTLNDRSPSCSSDSSSSSSESSLTLDDRE